MNEAIHFIEEKYCRICGGGQLDIILKLGHQPLANALVPDTNRTHPVVSYPLTLVRCKNCELVQVRETVSPEVLFNEYLYFSSYSETLVANAQELSNRLIQEHNLSETDLVVDIASNDGYLLQFYRDAGIPVLGVEPAANVSKVAREERCIPTLVEFFDQDTAERIRLEYGPATVIHANNVLAHVAVLHSFVEGMRILLAESGFIVVEVAYVKDMIDTGSFDLIYHEHLCYFSLGSIEQLFHRHQLAIFDVEHIQTHGGSLRVYVGHPGYHQETPSLYEFRTMEEEAGIGSAPFYEQLLHSVSELRQNLRSALEQLKREGNKIVAYGAAAKATVLLNFFDLGSDILDYIVDRNPQKQGRILPGTYLEIFPVEQIELDRPDIIVITAWNYSDEIMRQLTSFQARGGKFVIPFPSLRIIE